MVTKQASQAWWALTPTPPIWSVNSNISLTFDTKMYARKISLTIVTIINAGGLPGAFCHIDHLVEAKLDKLIHSPSPTSAPTYHVTNVYPTTTHAAPSTEDVTSITSKPVTTTVMSIIPTCDELIGLDCPYLFNICPLVNCPAICDSCCRYHLNMTTFRGFGGCYCYNSVFKLINIAYPSSECQFPS